MPLFYFLLGSLFTLCVAAQNEKQKKPQKLTDVQSAAYFGVFLGELRNASYGIEAGRVYLVNESHIQVVGFTAKRTKIDSKLRFSFSTTAEVGNAEDVFEVKRNSLSEQFLIAKNDHIENGINVRLVIKVPKQDFSRWKYFGIVSEVEWKYLTAVQLSNKSPPRPFCCLPPLNGWVYNVKSDPIEIINAQTLRIPKFSFEGQKPPDGWFFVGKGPVEKLGGKKCYVSGRDTKELWCPLREEYYDHDIIILLPDDETVYTIQWLSVYCVEVGVDFGHIEFEINPVTLPVPAVIPPIGERNSSIADFGWDIPFVYAKPDKDASRPIDLTFTLGPAGGIKAKVNRGTCEILDRVWYVQGEMQPNIYVQRGVTYRFKIYGGFANPLYLTTGRSGGWSQKPENEKPLIKNFAGDKGDAAGDLCEWKPYNDTRALKPDSFADFGEYRHFLNLHCSNSARPYEMKWIPGQDVPNEIYYASFTQYFMGGRIFVCNNLDGDALKPKCVQ